MSIAATSDDGSTTPWLRSGCIGAPSNTCLHCHPPLTPAIMLGRWRYLAGALGLLLLCNGYDPNLEPRSPLDVALRSRRWDLLDLLLDWGADPLQVNRGELFDTYNSELWTRFQALGMDLYAGHALASALAHHTSNKPLFGFVKHQRERDPRMQRS